MGPAATGSITGFPSSGTSSRRNEAAVPRTLGLQQGGGGGWDTRPASGHASSSRVDDGLPFATVRKNPTIPACLHTLEPRLHGQPTTTLNFPGPVGPRASVSKRTASQRTHSQRPRTKLGHPEAYLWPAAAASQGSSLEMQNPGTRGILRLDKAPGDLRAHKHSRSLG